jgi:hypothetical protein
MTPYLLFLYFAASAAGLLLVGIVALIIFVCFLAVIGSRQPTPNTATTTTN